MSANEHPDTPDHESHAYIAETFTVAGNEMCVITNERYPDSEWIQSDEYRAINA